MATTRPFSKNRQFSQRQSDEEEEQEPFDPNNYVEADGGALYSKCEYRKGGVKCQKPGTMCKETKGRGHWFCKEHFWKE